MVAVLVVVDDQFGERHGEDPVVVRRRGVVGADCRGETDRAPDGVGASLSVEVAIVVRLRGLGPGGLDRQNVLGDGEVDIVLLEAREVDHGDEGVVVLAEVRGHLAAERPSVVELAAHLLELPGHPAEEVVELIQDAEDRDAAKAALKERYEFSEAQAEHVVRMQLGSLTSAEVGEIEAEYEDVQAEIERLEAILASEEKLDEVVKDELREIKDEYDDDRRTSIVEDAGTVTREDLIPEEDVVVVMTAEDYIKRMPADQFDPQNRGGKGIIGSDPKEGDRVTTVFQAHSHDLLLCFTNHGQVYKLKTYEIPEMSRTARGKSAVNLLDLSDGEDITAVVPTDDLEPDECITMATRDGYVKRTCCDQFENILSTGIRAAKLEDGDELVDVEVTDGTKDLVIATEDGMTIRFDEDEVRQMGRSARGVRGIDLREGDHVAGLVATDDADERDLLTVTRNGYGKRTPLSEYRRQSRYGKGLIDIKTDERNGPVTDVKAVEQDDHIVVMSASGQIMRCPVADISTVGRNTKGVVIMDVDEGDSVACVDVLPAEPASEDESDE